jgi:ABC-type transporter Mla subunit MlaD
MGKHPSLTIAAVVIVAVGLVIALSRPAQFHLNTKCYFQNAQGLRAGAKVRLAGVEIGSVTSVRVRPQLKDYPAEVVMSLETPYELNIPNDSVVTLETAGVLGEVFPEIDTRGASGCTAIQGSRTQSSERRNCHATKDERLLANPPGGEAGRHHRFWWQRKFFRAD